jgi:hypothetical protein
LIPVVRSPIPKALQKNSAKWLAELQQQQRELQSLENDPNARADQIKRAKKKVDDAQKKYRDVKSDKWLAELQQQQIRLQFDLQSLINDPNATASQIKRAKKKVDDAQSKCKGVKNVLKEMFHGKCAYCESKVTHVTYGAIEHFHPKSKYPDLTFEWSNLLFSCDVCNDANHKGVQFPLDIHGNPLLIDPTDGITDPNMHLEFAWDAIAGLASVYGRDDRGKTVENIFDLNGRGRKELVAHRSEHVQKLCVLLDFAQKGNERAIALLRKACNADAEYSAFAIAHIQPHLPES